MVTIVEQNEKEHYPKIVECPHCRVKLQYYKEDVYHGFGGLPFIDCPSCNQEIDLLTEGYEEDILLTPKNIKFPQHFYHCSKSSGAVECSKQEINNTIQECIKYLDENPKNEWFYTGCGDTTVMVFRDFDNPNPMDGYLIWVIKDMYDGICKAR